MALKVVAAARQHLFGSTVNLYLSLVNESSGSPVTGQTPTIAIRRASDGFFFNGTAFVNTGGTPTNLSMAEVGATPAPGLYKYSFVDPGPVVPVSPTPQLTKDTYELRFVNVGGPPTGGTALDIIAMSRQLRDINTQGS